MTGTPTAHADDFAGLRRDLEIGLLLAPTRACAPAAAKSLAALLDTAAVPVRLAGLAVDGSRVRITLAVGMGSIDEVKVAGPASRAAVRLLQRILDDLAAYDPAFTTLPDPSSVEARLAMHVTARPERLSVVGAIRRLAAVG